MIWFQSVSIRYPLSLRASTTFLLDLFQYTSSCTYLQASSSLFASLSVRRPEYNDYPFADRHRFMDSISTRQVRSRTIRIRIHICSFVPHHRYGYGGFALLVLFSIENRLFFFLLMNMDLWCLHLEWITE
jgi:hypothetical protein